jgi:hypothetical protein
MDGFKLAAVNLMRLQRKNPQRLVEMKAFGGKNRKMWILGCKKDKKTCLDMMYRYKIIVQTGIFGIYAVSF